jgi:hypothetical protein
MPEIVDDELTKRAGQFYLQVFGEEVNDPEYDGDWLIMDINRFQSLMGDEWEEEEWNQPITIFIQVHSIDETIPKVERAGGKIIQSKSAMEGMGYYVVCKDTINIVFGMWESDENAS